MHHTEYLTMTDNIVDFTKRLQKIKADAAKPIAIDKYQLPNSSILMDPALQLDLLVQVAADSFISGDLEANKVHRLLTLIQFLYVGFSPQFDLKTCTVTRTLPEEERDLTSYSVYNWAMPMDRMRVNEGDIENHRKFSYQIEAQLVDIGDTDTVIDKGTIYPEDWMEFDIEPDAVITKRTARRFVKQMNELVRINGGQGILTDDGYLVFLPYGGKLAMMVVLVLENPIKLIPEDQRKKPE